MRGQPTEQERIHYADVVRSQGRDPFEVVERQGSKRVAGTDGWEPCVLRGPRWAFAWSKFPKQESA